MVWYCVGWYGIVWDTVEYAMRHLYFPYTHEPSGECVYRPGRTGPVGPAMTGPTFELGCVVF